MKKFLALLSIFSVLFLNFGAGLADAAISQYGLPGIYNSSPFTLSTGSGSALSTDQQGRLIVSPSSSVSTWTVSSSLTAGAIFVPTSTTYNLYVATTGTDNGLCTTQSSPCKTLEYTFNKIPTINGGVTQVNINDGTYTVTSTYAFKFHASASGNSDYNSVIKVVGNSTAPQNVRINAPSGNVAALEIFGDSTLMDFDGFTVVNPYNGFVLEKAFAIFRNVYIENYKVNGILTSYQTRLQVPSTATLGLQFTSDGTQDFSSGISNTVNSSVLVQAPFSVTGFAGANSRGIVTLLNSNTNILTGSLNIVATSTGAGSGINTQQSSITILASSGTIGNITRTSTSLTGAITTSDNSRTSFAGGLITLSTSTIGFSVKNGFLTDTAVPTITYNNVTTKALLYNGGIIDGASNFGLTASDISYTPALRSATGFYGYDQRYGLLNATNTWNGVNTFASPTAFSNFVDFNGYIFVNGGFVQHYTTVNDTNYNAITTEGYLAVSSTSAAPTIILPQASIMAAGFTYTIKDRNCNAGTNNIFVSSTASTIDKSSATTTISTNCASVQFVSDGVSNWEIN